MALSNRINMRGSGGGAPSGNYIFKNGQFIVPMSANQFSRSGYTMSMATQDGSGNLIITTNSNSNYCIAGTAYPIDLTDVDVIVFKAKSTAVYSAKGIEFTIQRTANVGTDASAISAQPTAIDSDFVDYSLDVRALSGLYYIFVATASTVRSGLVSEIYLV